VKRSGVEIILAIALVAYIVGDVLLTPPAHLETRDPALVTTLGVATLVLLFIGLALSVIALVLLFRRSSRAPLVAIIGAVVYFPAPLTELTGHFSSLRAPAAIAALEVVQAIVAVIVIVVALQALRRSANTN
jgi:hypothetical protein